MAICLPEHDTIYLYGYIILYSYIILYYIAILYYRDILYTYNGALNDNLQLILDVHLTR